jgi:hypothetical protein
VISVVLLRVIWDHVFIPHFSTGVDNYYNSHATHTHTVYTFNTTCYPPQLTFPRFESFTIAPILTSSNILQDDWYVVIVRDRRRGELVSIHHTSCAYCSAAYDWLLLTVQSLLVIYTQY